jgi:UDP-N-acetylglucosamine diphosphorylase/glucosamine-1-phosphate N-acetyltransferase
MKDVVVVIMAGGLGKRMGSNVPKVLHKLGDIPMLCHILIRLNVLSLFLNIKKILIVVGKFKDLIKAELDNHLNLPDYEFVIQEEPLGTGHAIQCCKQALSVYPESETLILSGDVPLIRPYTMNKLISIPSPVKIITAKVKEPCGYGRIIRNGDYFEKIIEHKDCSETELEINEINSGIYAINTSYLCKHLPSLKNNNSQKEYYLTDIIEIIKREESVAVGTYEMPEEDQYETTGVNTLEQLKELEKILPKKLEQIIIKNKIE